MTGKFEVCVESKRLRYVFEIRRNITILRGDSGIGKTTLVRMIMLSRRKNSPYVVKSEKECLGITADSYIELKDLPRYRDCIIFMDEEVEYIQTKEFAHVVKNSNCYFVIVTREKLEMLPYSCKEIYTIERGKVISGDVRINNDMHSLYTFIEKPKLSLQGSLSCIIVEDKNSGYEFFKHIADKMGIDCISAGGNSNIIKIYSERVSLNIDTGILIIVDSAAFGPYYESLRSAICSFFNTLVYLPESFEFILLNSDLLKTEEVANTLKHTYDYAESQMYFSWERYYTHILEEVTRSTVLKYSKKSLNPNYLISENLREVTKQFVAELGLTVG